MTYRIIAILLLFGSAVCKTWAAPRVAVLSGTGVESIASLLTAQLSTRGDIELVERDEIDRVLKEHALSAAGLLRQPLSIAPLLHADGLLILDKVSLSGGDVLSARLTASGPGAVIGAALFTPRKDDPAGLADAIAARFAPLWPKLKIKREQAIPISLLNLRCAVKSARAEQLESQLTFLLWRHLIAQPEFFVLERWRLGDADFEKAFAHADEGAFWTGSYIVDGEVNLSGSNAGVTVFVRPPGGAVMDKIEVTGNADNLPALAGNIAERLTSLLAKQPAAASWNPRDEAVQYAREADWAVRNGLFNVAHAAAESAWALGDHDWELQMRRIGIDGELAYPTRDHNEPGEYNPNVADVSVDLGRIRLAQAALDGFADFIPQLNTDNACKVERVSAGTGAIAAASRVLRNAYDHGMRSGGSLQDLRSGIRKIYPLLRVWEDEDSRGGTWSRIGQWGPDLIAAVNYPYWYENPRDATAACRELLEWKPAPRIEYHAALLRELLLERKPLKWEREALGDTRLIPSEPVAPWLVAWNGETPQQLTAIWNDFVNSLINSPRPAERVDGLLLQIATRGDQKAVNLAGAFDQIWDARDDLLKENRIEAVIYSLNDYLPGIDPSWNTRWLIYYLDHASVDQQDFLWKFFDQGTFTEAEAAEIYKAWPGFKARVTAAHQWRRNPGFYASSEANLLTHFPQLISLAPAGSLSVTHFWAVPGTAPDIVEAQYSGGKLWLCVSGRAPSPEWGAIYGIDLPSLTVAERIEFPPSTSMRRPGRGGLEMDDVDLDLFDASDAAFYVASFGKISRYDRSKHTWSILEPPLPGHWSAIQADGPDLYAARSGNYGYDGNSGIWKWTASTGEWQVICSNRRRPARNQFDDCAGYLVSGLFPGSGGKLGAAFNYRPYLYNFDTEKWEVIGVENDTVGYCVAAGNSTLILADEGATGLIKGHGGLEWLGGVTPNHAKPGASSLAPAFQNVFNHVCDPEMMISYADGALWFTMPPSLSPAHIQTLQRIEWSNPAKVSKPIPLDFESAPYAKDRLRILATDKGIVFWEFALPGFWFVPTKDIVQ